MEQVDAIVVTLRDNLLSRFSGFHGDRTTTATISATLSCEVFYIFIIAVTFKDALCASSHKKKPGKTLQLGRKFSSKEAASF